MITDSNSSGAALRQPLEIVICGCSISGVSWMGNLKTLSTPKTMIKATMTRIAAGFFSAVRVKFIWEPLIFHVFK
jgi:hypothetical protein